MNQWGDSLFMVHNWEVIVQQMKIPSLNMQYLQWMHGNRTQSSTVSIKVISSLIQHILLRVYIISNRISKIMSAGCTLLHVEGGSAVLFEWCRWLCESLFLFWWRWWLWTVETPELILTISIPVYSMVHSTWAQWRVT